MYEYVLSQYLNAPSGAASISGLTITLYLMFVPTKYCNSLWRSVHNLQSAGWMKSTTTKLSLIKGEVLKKCLQTMVQIFLYFFPCSLSYVIGIFSCVTNREPTKNMWTVLGWSPSLQTQQFSLQPIGMISVVHVHEAGHQAFTSSLLHPVVFFKIGQLM